MLKSLLSLRSAQSLHSRDLLASLERIRVKPVTMLLGLGGILAVAYIVVLASYAMEHRDQSSALRQIEAGGGTLAGVGDSQQTLQDLQDRLSFTKAGLANLQQAFPTKLDSTLIVQSLLDYAGRSHVDIRQVTAMPATQVVAPKEDEGNVAYTVLRYTVVVDGELPDMLTFLRLLESSTSQTAALGDIAVTEGSGVEEMVLDVTFYARSASTDEGADGSAAPAPTPAPAASQPQSDRG